MILTAPVMIDSLELNLTKDVRKWLGWNLVTTLSMAIVLGSMPSITRIILISVAMPRITPKRMTRTMR